MKDPEIEHGTYAGAQKCRIDGHACDECKAAYAEYMREYREKHPEQVKKERKRNSIRLRALVILKNRHLPEYQSIVTQLLKE